MLFIRTILTLIGRKINEKQRENLQRELETADLTQEELKELGPYVQIAVKHGGLTTKLQAGVVTVITIGLILAGLLVDTAGIVFLAFAAIFGILLYLSLYRALRIGMELETKLQENPQWILGPNYDGRYEKWRENIDYDQERYGSFEN